MPQQKQIRVNVGSRVYYFPEGTSPKEMDAAIRQAEGQTASSGATLERQPEMTKLEKFRNFFGISPTGEDVLRGREDEDVLTRGIKGVARAGRALVTTPVELLAPPQTPEEISVYGAGGDKGMALLAAKRGLYDPAAHAFSRMKEKVGESLTGDDPMGSMVEASGHALAGMIPLFGPIGESLGETAGRGDIAGAVGEAAGLYGLPKLMGKAATAGEGLERLAPMGETMLGLTDSAKLMPRAAAGMARTEVVQTAKSKGIVLTPGQATGSRTLRGVDYMGEHAIVGGGRLRNMMKENLSKFIDWTDEYAERLDPRQRGAVAEDAGEAIRKDVEQAFQRRKKDADAAYTATRVGSQSVAQILNDIDLSPLKQWIRQEFTDPASGQLLPLDPEMTKLFNEFSSAPDLNATTVSPRGVPQSSFTAAKLLRTKYLDKAHDFSGNIPRSHQALYSKAAQIVDQAIERSAQMKGPHVLDAWRNANAKWTELQDLYNTPGRPLYQILQSQKPLEVVGKIVEAGQFGGSPGLIRLLKQEGIDLAPVKRSIFYNARSRNFVLTRMKLSGYSDAFLAELFRDDPAALRELMAMGEVGRALRFRANPSETAGMTAVMRQLELASHVGMRGFAGLKTAGMSEMPFTGAARFASSPMMQDIFSRTPPPGYRATPFEAGAGAAVPALTKQEELRRRKGRRE